VNARKRLEISGIVQGVGFRPFIYRLAETRGLAGWVSNSTAGVLIEVEGVPANVDAFLGDLATPPPLAHIDDLHVHDVAPDGARGFEIRESSGECEPFLLVPPDIAACDDCRRDFTTPGNRRYQYPFTNCTNCGPRYTIIQDIPYDRPLTTMSTFRMCPECEAEYRDPADRRFHAQPNACPVCGPAVTLEATRGGAEFRSARGREQVGTLPHGDARRLLREGHILAIKGLGGFHLACAAENDAAVRLLRERKRRSDKPFAVMARDPPPSSAFASSLKPTVPGCLTRAAPSSS